MSPPEAVSVVDCPVQKEALPEICGFGVERMMTCCETELGPQMSVTVKTYVPAVVTVIDGVVAPVDQLFPDELPDVRVTEPPGQKLVGPSGVILAGGGVLSVTVWDAVSVPQEVIADTVYVPGEVTEIEELVSPFGDQEFPFA